MASFILKSNRDRNRPVIKQGKAKIADALAAHDRIQAISDEIRARHGLKPLPDNVIVAGWRSGSAGMVRAGSETLPERAVALAKAKAKLARDQAKIDAETAAIAAAVKGTREVTKVAGLLGLSRQRLYQLAA